MEGLNREKNVLLNRKRKTKGPHTAALLSSGKFYREDYVLSEAKSSWCGFSLTSFAP